MCLLVSVAVVEVTQPSSLHHLVWLGVQFLSLSGKTSICEVLLPVKFRATSFTNLQFVHGSSSSGHAESLSRIDVDAFLFACGEFFFQFHYKRADYEFRFMFCFIRQCTALNRRSFNKWMLTNHYLLKCCLLMCRGYFVPWNMSSGKYTSEKLGQYSLESLLVGFLKSSKVVNELSFLYSDHHIMLPSFDCTFVLCRWESAVLVNSKTVPEEDFSHVRLVLQRGLEAVRLIGNNSLPLPLLVLMGRTFANKVIDEIVFVPFVVIAVEVRII